MRLAVLSDVHGNLAALDAVLATLEEIEGTLDRIWVLGDLAAFGPHPAASIRRVRELAGRWPDRVSLLQGNTDRYLATGERRAIHPPVDRESFPGLAGELRDRDLSLAWTVSRLGFDEHSFLAGLPREPLRLEVPGFGGVVGYHGLPGDDEGWLDPETPLPNPDFQAAFAGLGGRLGIGGHVHLPMDRSFRGWRLLNAGSVGAPRARGGAEYLLVDFAGGQATVHPEAVAYDEAAAVADLGAAGAPAADWMRRKMHFPPFIAAGGAAGRAADG